MSVTAELPAWIEPRDTQTQAVNEICEAYASGAQVVMLDGPVGTGKTIIAELVRRRLDVPTLYMCSDRALQDQVAGDFPYAKVLKGRGNYPSQHSTEHMCDECEGESCHLCDFRSVCPYVQAKVAALGSDLAVVNTSYFLHEANYVGEIGGRRGLIVADEGDLLEDALMGFVGYTSPEWLMRAVKMDAPGKGVRKKRLAAWLEEFAQGILKVQSRWAGDVKLLNRAKFAAGQARRVAQELLREEDTDDDSGKWLREYKTRWARGKYVDDGVLRLAPVLVSGYGNQYLWRHARRWLVMSATLISPDEISESLGLPLEWAYVTSPMTFAPEARPIIMAPVANVVRSGMNEAVDALATALVNVSRMHEGERVLVHTVSFDLARRLVMALGNRMSNHDPLAYDAGGTVKDAAMQRFLDSDRAMLFAASMSRGVDLAGDKCRVQVITKCPFPYLGDRRVSARMHLPGGQLWYSVQAVRSLVQMTGRIVRGPEDYGTTYILDRQFVTNMYRQSMRLFPKWWRDAVVTNFPTSQLMKVSN